jgi:hypothetical protein
MNGESRDEKRGTQCAQRLPIAQTRKEDRQSDEAATSNRVTGIECEQ